MGKKIFTILSWIFLFILTCGCWWRLRPKLNPWAQLETAASFNGGLLCIYAISTKICWLNFRIHLTWTCSWAVLVPSLCCIWWRIGWWRIGVAGTSRSWVTTWVARDPRLLLLGWVSCELSWVAWSWVLWCSTWVPWACVWIWWVTGSTHTWHRHRKWLTCKRNTRLLLFSTFTNQIVPSNCRYHFSM